MANPQTKEYLLGLLLIVFGVLVIAIPYMLEWIVGLAFVLLGVVHFIPAGSSK
jgi:uncharacterized membrane protein HdeD (DUF308 family)